MQAISALAFIPFGSYRRTNLCLQNFEGLQYARNMLVTLGPNFSSISCQNREKFEPLLLACLTM